MPASPSLKLLRSVKTGKGLINLIKNLKVNRRLSKITDAKRSRLSSKQREEVLAKTAGHCHICGIELNGEFQADHVKAHSTGGSHTVDNYLPSCSTCNNYRWHYSPEEIQVILKLGVWAKTKMCNDELLGLDMANAFMQHEMDVRKRRKAVQQGKAEPRKYFPQEPLATLHPDEYVLGGPSEYINPAKKLPKRIK